MGSTIERNHRFRRQPAVHVNGHAVQVAERRHCADFRVGEQTAQLTFRRETEMRQAEPDTQFLQVDSAVTRDDCHSKPFISHEYDRLCHLMRRDVLRNRDFPRGVGWAMDRVAVLGLARVQHALQSGTDRHKHLQTLDAAG
ncbi:MAG: hypothetical protein L0219_13180, partial [Phycisphaerales bacterium]|nr:hypothetical protein [Phycisphaerales bacterium]